MSKEMSHRDSNEDKLVEDISIDVECLIGGCVKQIGLFIARNEDRERLNEVMEYWSKKITQKVITRIGKAYADGELELPGEVGRVEGILAEEIISHFFSGHTVDYDEEPSDILIALRPLSGTSKKEEG